MAYQQITLAQLQTLLSARFDNGNGFWSSQEQIDAINESLSLFQCATGRWRQRYILTTVANRCFYFIPGLAQLQASGICQVLQPIRASFNGLPALGFTSISDMDLSNPGWQAQTTATSGAPTTPQMCGPAGLNYFFLWPADAAGNNSLAVDALTNAPQLVNAGDFINLDSTEIVGVLDYSQWRLSFKRGGLFFQRTFPLFQGYLKILVERNAYLANLAPFRQIVGADFARNYSPRRISDRTGREFALGLR